MRTEAPRTPMPSGQDAPAREVVAWRERQLLDSGFDAALAARLALDCAFDLHALVELVERGCPHETAARILAPLPGERKPC